MKARKHTVVSRSLEERSMKQGIYTVPVFMALIQHERNRVDRDGKEFSLAIFQSEGMATWNSVEIIEKIKKAMRNIDEVGWLDDQNIGVLLPSTTMDGGHRFARRVSGHKPGADALSAKGLIPFRVYSYPRHWISVEPGERGTYTPSNCGDEEADPQSLRKAFGHRIPVWKRALDIFGSLVGLILLSPLFAAVAAYIKIVSPGPAFFRQDRMGYGGRVFTFYKFRTMHHNNDQGTHRDHIIRRMRASNSSLEKLDDKDPRIYRGGKLLRKACIDELPQLFNVLRGDMSLVGPRPCLPYEADVFLRWHRHRFDVLPGMTGLWQVSGKNKLTFIQMIRLDIAYAKKMSLWRDLLLILRTFPAIIVMLIESRQANKERKAKAAAELAARKSSEEAVVSIPAEKKEEDIPELAVEEEPEKENTIAPRLGLVTPAFGTSALQQITKL